MFDLELYYYAEKYWFLIILLINQLKECRKCIQKFVAQFDTVKLMT